MTQAKTQEQAHWQKEDSEFDQEFAEVIQFIREDKTSPKTPRHLNRKILDYARARQSDKLEKNWLLGQGPWVILVTVITFAIAVLTLLVRG